MSLYPRFAVLLAAAALAGVAALAPRAEALPRYAARYEQTCALCHVNPSGAGLRTTYASQFLVPEEIAWKRSKPAVLSELDSTLSKSLQVGTDFREDYIGSDVRQGHFNFFQMESNIYFLFQLDPRVSVYYSHGRSETYEMFGLGYVLPILYFKAGRFVPSYGWKYDDHTMFVRDVLGFGPPLNTDVGVETGLSRGPLDVQADVVNGNPGGIFDNDTKAAVSLNAIYRRHVGPFGTALGASGYHRPGDGSEYDTWGAYGYVTWRAFTWIGEGDVLRRKPAGSAAVEGLVTSHELTCFLRQGLQLIATYDYYDADRDADSGSKSRWGGGVYVMPYPYLTLEALLRRTTYRSGPALSGPDAYETVLMVHLFR